MDSKYLKRQITIKDVAREAGVSISTVSRVINNKEIVKEEKVAKVVEAIKKLSYTPNPAARSLIVREMTSVAVLVPNIVNTSISEMVKGALSVLNSQGINLLVFDSNENKEIENKHLKYLIEKKLDGLLFIAGSGSESTEEIEKVAEVMPVVLLSRRNKLPYVDTFDMDNELGMKILLEYLWGLGHKKIAFLAGEKGSAGSNMRLKAFKEALSSGGKIFEDNLIYYSEWSMQGGKDAFKELMNRDIGATAVICAIDNLAIGAISAAHELEIRIPEDISIVGFDNSIEGRFIYPPLTTLDYPNIKLGEIAAEALIERFYDSEKKEVFDLLPLRLLKRSSAGPVKK